MTTEWNSIVVQPWIAAPVSLGLVAAAVFCHRNWRAMLPEDPPGTGRRRHSVPTPMAGFLPAIVAVAALAWCGVSPFVIGGIALATLTGLFDDRGKSLGNEMPWQWKGVLLSIAAGAVLFEVASTREISVSEGVIAFCWLFGMTNAVNFMDNTDGVAASLGALALLLASQGDGAMAFAGFAFLGFVPANWPRAQVFLGDSGSLGLGMCVAFATLQIGLDADPRAEFFPLDWWALAPVAVFLIDFVQVIFARLILGVPPWVGDRRHLTHISMNLGLPPSLVAPLFVAAAYGIYVSLG